MEIKRKKSVELEDSWKGKLVFWMGEEYEPREEVCSRLYPRRCRVAGLKRILHFVSAVGPAVRVPAVVWRWEHKKQAVEQSR
jgi:hypothetical protein